MCSVHVLWCVMSRCVCVCLRDCLHMHASKRVLPASVFATALGNQPEGRPSGLEQSKLECKDRQNPITTKCHSFYHLR